MILCEKPLLTARSAPPSELELILAAKLKALPKESWFLWILILKQAIRPLPFPGMYLISKSISLLMQHMKMHVHFGLVDERYCQGRNILRENSHSVPRLIPIYADKHFRSTNSMLRIYNASSNKENCGPQDTQFYYWMSL